MQIAEQMDSLLDAETRHPDTTAGSGETIPGDVSSHEPPAGAPRPGRPAGQWSSCPSPKLLVEQKSTRDCLSRIVRTMTSNEALREDLLQEAMIHLWLRELHRPGQTRSWYLHSCRFHLQHYLAAGRSVDSRKHGNLEVNLALEDDESIYAPDHLDTDVAFLEKVCATELICLLCPRLKPRGQAVLACLADGLGLREIARKLCITHPTVCKYRSEIAGLALKLGIPRPTNGHSLRRNGARRRNGVKHPGLAARTLSPLEAPVASTSVLHDSGRGPNIRQSLPLETSTLLTRSSSGRATQSGTTMYD